MGIWARARDKHEPRTCTDESCERFGCRMWREGWQEGYDAGEAAGYGSGYADGFSTGYAQGIADAGTGAA